MQNNFLLLFSASDIIANLSKWNVILGIIAMIIGVATVFSIHSIIQRTKLDDEKKSKIILTAKISALALTVLGALAVCF